MTGSGAPELGFRAIQSAWARTLVASLYDAGATHFVVSPGSRSTPLVAALQALGITPDLVTDERSAAFLALGRGKLRDVPSVLICTSGSAPFHYFPAVVEADESRTPLIIVSADRPPELQGNRAFQTTEQRHLFGSRVRWSDDLGVAEASDAALLGLRRKAAQAVALSLGPIPGAVHLNAPFRKPLEPDGANLPVERAVRAHPIRRHLPAVSSPSPRALSAVAELFEAARRPVLVVGPHAPPRAPDPAALRAFLERTRWPLFAEATSNVRESSPGFDLVLRALSRPNARGRFSDYCPDAVLQIGNVPTSASWLEAARGLPRAVLSDTDLPDPTNSARILAGGSPGAWLPLLGERVNACSPDFVERWQRADNLADALARELCGGVEQTFEHEGQPVRALADSLASDDLLIVGNSLPVRLLDTFARVRVDCLSQRGHNGIDGLVAGAVGAAGAHPGRSVLLLGDVSLLHDVGSLKCVNELSPRLTVVVLNNQGGRLFEQLPIATSGTDLTPWLTPHQYDLSRIAAGFGISNCRVDHAAALGRALSKARASGLPALIEVLVPPSGTGSAYRTLTERVAAALEAEPT